MMPEGSKIAFQILDLAATLLKVDFSACILALPNLYRQFAGVLAVILRIQFPHRNHQSP
jgi:hypothetical protein